MGCVTITRQFGSGGSEVARRVAAALGWTLIDNEFVDQVAIKAGLPVATVAAHEERAPALNERLIRALATSSPEMFVPAAVEQSDEAEEETLVRVTARVIDEAAQHGRAVLVGRGAQAVLAADAPDGAINVWVTATREARVRTVMERLGLSAADAARTMDDTDASRDRYVKKWHGRARQDPANYHLVVNTASLGYEGAAALVVAAVRQRGWT